MAVMVLLYRQSALEVQNRAPGILILSAQTVPTKVGEGKVRYPFTVWHEIFLFYS